ncbi:hypothetical protein CCR94_16325 [Rhodoblastus sphagnicola]|uniref:Uncharacterized protein n=1 Tax=Rhodoblastus sphagnicola TaxID=333368 RepID=A0A2S6N2Y6_9HYPH|nr:hypothetical protein [Rhodoblastus sphagnicola]MBB4199061.1 hypothetical protein [Rhodoblastus sphagnicola]PPQ28956.1 hypothetical protein CCR94_16325 [Rhodoblastus sphagnicola]
MAALTAGRLPKVLLNRTWRRFPVAASTVIWEGGMVALSGAGSSAVAVPASASAALKVVGVADGTADNRTGGAGALSADANLGTYLMNNDATDPVTISDIGNTVYVSDDNTISKTSNSGAKPAAGTLFNIDSTGAAWVTFN